MEQFQRLGAEVEDAWREQGYNEEIFPALAADALSRADLPSKLSAWDAIEWTLAQTELPPQKDPNASFGNPPITLYNGPRFHIDIYFWLDGTTQIHQHGFCGAFQVLLGSSLHTWYEFEATEKINFFTEIGKMRIKECELLSVGDVHEILAGRQYIHSLFHLDQPSATIVIRTSRTPMSPPQFSYHKPSLAVDPFFDPETTTKKLQSIRALFHVKHPRCDEMVSTLLETSDFQTSFAILSAVHEFLIGGLLDELFGLESPADRFKSFLDIVVRRHGPKAGDLAAVFAHRERLREIVRRRAYVTNPEHRFFLALVLNVEGRDSIFSLVQSRYPDVDPADKILDWTYELAQTRVVGVTKANALGIENFDDIDLSILENLIRGRSETEMRETMAKEYLPEKLATIDLEEKLARINGSAIFRPLLLETAD